MPEILTVSQAADFIGVSRQYVQILIGKGEIKAFKMLARWAVPESEVERIKGKRAKKKRAVAQKAKK